MSILSRLQNNVSSYVLPLAIGGLMAKPLAAEAQTGVTFVPVPKEQAALSAQNQAAAANGSLCHMQFATDPDSKEKWVKDFAKAHKKDVPGTFKDYKLDGFECLPDGKHYAANLTLKQQRPGEMVHLRYQMYNDGSGRVDPAVDLLDKETLTMSLNAGNDRYVAIIERNFGFDRVDYAGTDSASIDRAIIKISPGARGAQIGLVGASLNDVPVRDPKISPDRFLQIVGQNSQSFPVNSREGTNKEVSDDFRTSMDFATMGARSYGNMSSYDADGIVELLKGDKNWSKILPPSLKAAIDPPKR